MKCVTLLITRRRDGKKITYPVFFVATYPIHIWSPILWTKPYQFTYLDRVNICTALRGIHKNGVGTANVDHESSVFYPENNDWTSSDSLFLILVVHFSMSTIILQIKSLFDRVLINECPYHFHGFAVQFIKRNARLCIIYTLISIFNESPWTNFQLQVIKVRRPPTFFIFAKCTRKIYALVDFLLLLFLASCDLITI